MIYAHLPQGYNAAALVEFVLSDCSCLSYDHGSDEEVGDNFYRDVIPCVMFAMMGI